MGTIGKTKAAEMAYKKIMMLKAQFYRKDLQPADDYKTGLMKRGSDRIEKNMESIKSENEQEDLLKIAKLASRIEQGFKGNQKT